MGDFADDLIDQGIIEETMFEDDMMYYTEDYNEDIYPSEE